MFSVKVFENLCNMRTSDFKLLPKNNLEEFKIASEVHKVLDNRKREAFVQRVIKSRTKTVPSASECIAYVADYSSQVQESLPPVTTVTPPRMATVKVRAGQAAFRLRVLDNFNNRCAVTGHTVSAVLEAAHITPYCDGNDNSVTNGIALDSALHGLFDAGLMAINPETLTVHFKCEHPYRIHEGRKLATPKTAINASALAQSWAKFNLRGL